MTEMTETRRWLIAAAVMLATILEILDSTIVSISLPNMMGSFGATTDQITWILTSYIVSSAIIMPLSGFLINRLGSKKLLLINIIGFLIASMLCGIATSLEQMVLFRILQGIFGASLVPLSQFILRNTFPPEQMMKAMAIWGVGIMAAPVMGPTLGGYITETLNWRWIFYVNLPFCLLAIYMCIKLIKETETRLIKTDILGIILLSLTVGALQIFLDRGNTVGWFEADSTRWLVGIFIFSFTAFLVHGSKHEHPIINLKLFLNKNFSAGCLMLALFAAGVIGVISIQPLMLENLMNYPTDFAGLIMAPRGIASAIGMACVPLLIKYIDGRILVALGIIICAASTYFLSLLTLEVSPAVLIWIGVIQGFGMGIFFVPISSLAFATLTQKDFAEASGIFSFGRNVGTSVGISLLSTLLTRESQINWNTLSTHIGPYSRAIISHGINLHDPIKLAQLTQQISSQASFISFLDAYRAVTLSFILMLPLVFLLSSKKSQGGIVIH
jgi:DHA2 family multidrug resistance protein